MYSSYTNKRYRANGPVKKDRFGTNSILLQLKGFQHMLTISIPSFLVSFSVAWMWRKNQFCSPENHQVKGQEVYEDCDPWSLCINASFPIPVTKNYLCPYIRCTCMYVLLPDVGMPMTRPSWVGNYYMVEHLCLLARTGNTSSTLLHSAMQLAIISLPVAKDLAMGTFLGLVCIRIYVHKWMYRYIENVHVQCV